MADVAYKPTTKYSPKNNTPLIQEKEYQPTFSEWAAKNRFQVCKGAVIVGAGNSTLYSVPQGFNMFVTGFSISSFIMGGGTSFLALASGGVSGTDINFGALSGVDLGGPVSSSMDRTFINPIKINSGAAIVVESNIPNQTVSGSVSGWIEPISSS